MARGTERRARTRYRTAGADPVEDAGVGSAGAHRPRRGGKAEVHHLVAAADTGHRGATRAAGDDLAVKAGFHQGTEEPVVTRRSVGCIHQRAGANGGRADEGPARGRVLRTCDHRGRIEDAEPSGAAEGSVARIAVLVREAVAVTDAGADVRSWGADPRSVTRIGRRARIAVLAAGPGRRADGDAAAIAVAGRGFVAESGSTFVRRPAARRIRTAPIRVRARHPVVAGRSRRGDVDAPSPRRDFQAVIPRARVAVIAFGQVRATPPAYGVKRRLPV